MPKLKAIEIEDNKQINKATQAVTNLVYPLNTLRNEYLKVFGNFDINSLIELMEVPDKKQWVIANFIKIKEIDVKGMSIAKVTELGLIDIPDYTALLAAGERIKNQIAMFCSAYVHSICELYDEEQAIFVNPFVVFENCEIEKRIYNQFTLKTENNTEVEFIRELEISAGLFENLLNRFKAIAPMQVPNNLFRVETIGGFKVVTVLPHVLKKFRKRAIPVETA